MESSTQGRLLKAAPARSEWSNTQTGRFFERIEAETGTHFETYRDAWQWSVDNLDQFWGELWRETAIIEHAPYSAVLGSTQMPGAEWFPGALINWGEHLVRGLRSQGDKPMQGAHWFWGVFRTLRTPMAVPQLVQKNLA